MSNPKLVHALDELLVSERAYLEHISILLNAYLHNIPRDPALNLSPEEVAFVTADTAQLVDFHSAFLPRLEKCFKNTDVYATLRKVASLFQATAAEFSIYESYCTKHAQVARLISSLRGDAWEAFERRCLDKTQQQTRRPKLHMQDYLIKPVQRICLYPLILLQIRSAARSPTTSPDPEIDNAISSMKAIAARLDKARLAHEIELVAAIVASRLTPSQPDLGSITLASGLDVLSERAHAPPRYLAAFLFSSSHTAPARLILASPKGKENSWSYVTRISVPLDQAQVLDEADLGYDLASLLPHSFHLTSTTGSAILELGASCAAERSIWIAAINELIANSKSSSAEELTRIDSISSEGHSRGKLRPPALAIDALSSPPHVSFSAKASSPQTPLSSVEGARSTTSLRSLFSPIPFPTSSRTSLNLSSSTPPISWSSSRISKSRRNSKTSIRDREFIDRALEGIISESCIRARMRAISDGERLFGSPDIGDDDDDPGSASGSGKEWDTSLTMSPNGRGGRFVRRASMLVRSGSWAGSGGSGMLSMTSILDSRDRKGSVERGRGRSLGEAERARSKGKLFQLADTEEPDLDDADELEEEEHQEDIEHNNPLEDSITTNDNTENQDEIVDISPTTIAAIAFTLSSPSSSPHARSEASERPSPSPLSPVSRSGSNSSKSSNASYDSSASGSTSTSATSSYIGTPSPLSPLTPYTPSISGSSPTVGSGPSSPTVLTHYRSQSSPPAQVSHRDKEKSGRGFLDIAFKPSTIDLKLKIPPSTSSPIARSKASSIATSNANSKSSRSPRRSAFLPLPMFPASGSGTPEHSPKSTLRFFKYRNTLPVAAGGDSP
ncbi:hypothetical protein SISSUDRAFT_1064121 [Sistotremastrum suecicum HHB10207 ss-3]|uniref:DH domain-containing protein n=1 Tax=Sistotremastrum suecicum HHB10207 ss-3 TaxID=1314776 RepID=A0A166B1I9_9AGAM|nr:hypothetical protein SISSUDRAFT_1064121 [Sistotremastrum suecicum HHB10207 ss-3]